MLGSLEAERSRVAREMDKVYRTFIADEISSEAFGRFYRPQIEKEQPRLQGEADFMRIQSGAREEVLAGAKDLFSHWAKLQPEEKREIVEAIVEKVVIGRSDVVIDLCYSPALPEAHPADGRPAGSIHTAAAAKRVDFTK